MGIARMIRRRKIRALVFSDLHLHPYRMFANFMHGDNSRRLEILQRLGVIVTKACESKYDCLLFAGDFFHERLKVDVVSLSEAKKIIGGFSKPFIGCSGTHDRTYSGHSSLEAISDRKGREGTAGDEYVCIDGTRTLFDLSNNFAWEIDAVPYMFDYGRQMEAIRLRRQQLPGAIPGGETKFWQHRRILLTHGDVVGYRYGSHVVEHGLNVEEIAELYDFSIIGHIHNPPEFTVDNRVLFPGACIPHTFGDVGGGRMWDVTFKEDGNHTVELMRFESPEFVTRAFSHPLEGNIIDVEGEMTTRNYYRFQVPAGCLVSPGTAISAPFMVQHIGIEEDEEAQTPTHLLGAETVEPIRLVSDYVDYVLDREAERGQGFVIEGWNPAQLKELGHALTQDLEEDALCSEIERIWEGVNR